MVDVRSLKILRKRCSRRGHNRFDRPRGARGRRQRRTLDEPHRPDNQGQRRPDNGGQVFTKADRRDHNAGRH